MRLAVSARPVLPILSQSRVLTVSHLPGDEGPLALPKVVPPPGVLTPTIEEMGQEGAMTSMPSLVPILDRSNKGGGAAGVEQDVKLDPRDDPGASSGDMRSASLRSVHEDDDKARDVIRTGGWVFQEEGAGQGADTAKGQV